MRENEIRVLSLHLRRIHFWITATTIGLIVAIFWYVDPRIGSAMSELEDLRRISEHWNPDKNLNLRSIKTKWLLTMESKDKEYNPSTSISKLALATANTLSNCDKYEEIERVTYDSYSKNLENNQINYMRCQWMGEDRLISFPVKPQNQLEWYQLKMDTEQLDNRIEKEEAQPSPQDQKEMGVASDVKSLNQCAKWMNIQRSRFDEFTTFLEKEMKVVSPILCSWEGENDLIIASVQPEWTEKIYLVTDNESEIIQIPPSPKGENIINKIKEQPDLEHYLGQKYSKAMPALHDLENEGELDPQHSIDKISHRLRRQLVPLEEITSNLHIPLTPEILSTGIPSFLILLQVYFLMHHRQLIYLLRQVEGSLPYSPWIGVYRDVFSLLMLGSTLLFMPPLAIGLLWHYEIAISLPFTRIAFLMSGMLSVYQAALIRQQRSIPHNRLDRVEESRRSD